MLKKIEVQRACYNARELAELIGCGINELNVLVERGEIPRPITGTQGIGKRRWTAAAIHKALGLPPSAVVQARFVEEEPAKPARRKSA